MALHCLQYLLGAVEALAAGIPDSLHHLLWCSVVLGGRGDLLRLGREPYAREVSLEGRRVEIAIRDGDKVEYEFRAPEAVLSNLKYKAE